MPGTNLESGHTNAKRPGYTASRCNSGPSARNAANKGEREIVINPGMMTSTTPEWATPQPFFDKLAAEFGGFDLDPCATSENAKCTVFYTETEDGLKQPWQGKVFMNPPYGREIGHWVEKAYAASLAGCLVVCLLPARTDTAWWHNYVMLADEVRFVRGRLKFGGSKNSAPFPSAVVIFRPRLPTLSQTQQK